jgi:hypothetical protein
VSLQQPAALHLADRGLPGKICCVTAKKACWVAKAILKFASLKALAHSIARHSCCCMLCKVVAPVKYGCAAVRAHRQDLRLEEEPIVLYMLCIQSRQQTLCCAEVQQLLFGLPWFTFCNDSASVQAALCQQKSNHTDSQFVLLCCYTLLQQAGSVAMSSSRGGAGDEDGSNAPASSRKRSRRESHAPQSRFAKEGKTCLTVSQCCRPLL